MEKLFESILQKACNNGGIATWFIIFWCAVGVVVYALKKNGLVTIGRGEGRRRCDKYCDVHHTHKEHMDNLKSDMGEMENGSKTNFLRLEEILEKVFDKIEDMNQTLSDHIGYCRGVQQYKNKKGST